MRLAYFNLRGISLRGIMGRIKKFSKSAKLLLIIIKFDTNLT